MPWLRAAFCSALVLGFAFPAFVHTAFAEGRRDIAAMMEAATVMALLPGSRPDNAAAALLKNSL